jgi:hypothetical protein
MLLNHTDVKNISIKYNLNEVDWNLYIRINGYILSTMDDTIPIKINLETVKNFWKNYENMDKNILKQVDCLASYCHL